MMDVKTVKVSEKGQIAIPADIRQSVGIKQGDTIVLIQEDGRILLQKVERLRKNAKDEFHHLLKHSEEVAKKFWSSEADDVWDTI
ncbi:AbrB/MazE/SpoVT family DNA-binding domain-containing protein [Candidatus Woesearchaeota archaeon]|nr:AbrB/MazE/SpoVT family DNA-binding domain-containing protein [Candidatus Woesearchaeota archaeon]